MSKFMLSIMGAFAEMERALIRERQREGIAIAKENGVYKGRKPKLTGASIEEVKQRIAGGEKKAAIARALGVSRQTLYSYL
jgi:DNA invertase Pin-like site-specific DNA recombinase